MILSLRISQEVEAIIIDQSELSDIKLEFGDIQEDLGINWIYRD